MYFSLINNYCTHITFDILTFSKIRKKVLRFQDLVANLTKNQIKTFECEIYNDLVSPRMFDFVKILK